MSTGMRIPLDSLAPDTLRRVVEEFVLREGTDYGRAVPTAQKVEEVLAQLRDERAVLLFDANAGTTNIITRKEWLDAGGG